MTEDKRTYQAYLLRLWSVNTGRSTIWHASLEDPQTGERRGFADLNGLLAFLEEQTRERSLPAGGDMLLAMIDDRQRDGLSLAQRYRN